MVRSTLVTAWRLAISPTRTSPFLANATTDGVVRPPSAFAMTVGSPPSRTATTEFVVPRSIPTARAIRDLLSRSCGCARSGGRLESAALKSATTAEGRQVDCCILERTRLNLRTGLCIPGRRGSLRCCPRAPCALRSAGAHPVHGAEAAQHRDVQPGPDPPAGEVVGRPG